MRKAIRIKYSPVFESQLGKLREAVRQKGIKFDRQLLKAIEREKDYLLIDQHRGIQIPKDRIPHEYIAEYGISNLWKIDLPDYWRMLYTITGNEVEIIIILYNKFRIKEAD